MKLVFAPMHGINLAHYRNIFAKHFGGIDTFFTPFIATTSKERSSYALFKDVYPENTSHDIHTVPQLLSNDGVNFRNFATTIGDMGYEEVNWNIGCPFPTVTKKVRGSGLMQHPDKVRRLLDEACKGTNYKTSVKMRLGYTSLEEGHVIMDILNEYPLSQVIIHGRTGEQKYEGVVDLDGFEALYKQAKHPVIYNGDIYTAADYQRIQARFPEIDTFMMGRGLRSNPFLGEDIKGIQRSHDEKLGILRAYHDDMVDHYFRKFSDDWRVLGNMKEFWTFGPVHLDTRGGFLDRIRRCQDMKTYYEEVDQLFENA